MKMLIRYVLPVLGTALAGGLATAVVATPASAATVRPAAENSFCKFSPAEPELEYGSKGDPVRQAQCELDSVINGPVSLPADGDFGPVTEQWTKHFQACMGIAQDGIIGPITWAKLDYYSSTQAPQPCDN